MQRVYALYTLEGVPDADVTTHYFSTEDQKLGLSMLRFNRGPSDDAVLIIHGLTTSSDMFIMPEHTNLVRYLRGDGGLRDSSLDLEFGDSGPKGPPQGGQRWDNPFRWIDTSCTMAPPRGPAVVPTMLKPES